MEDYDEMTEHELIERIAAGLRAVSKYKPIGFIVANGFKADRKEYLGLHVYQIGDITHQPYSDYACPLFPVFEVDVVIPWGDADVSFARAFYNYPYDRQAEKKGE